MRKATARSRRFARLRALHAKRGTLTTLTNRARPRIDELLTLVGELPESQFRVYKAMATHARATDVPYVRHMTDPILTERFRPAAPRKPKLHARRTKATHAPLDPNAPRDAITGAPIY